MRKAGGRSVSAVSYMSRALPCMRGFAALRPSILRACRTRAAPQTTTSAPPLQSLSSPPVLVHRRPHDGFRLGRGPVVESRDAGRVLAHDLGWSHGPLRSDVGRVAGALYGVSALWRPRDPHFG